MFWSKKKPIRLEQKREPISEFTQAMLERDGVWVEVDFLISNDIPWYTISYRLPDGITEQKFADILAAAAYNFRRGSYD